MASPPPHQPSAISRGRYEPAIDGLRAVAVALVIGFHFGVPFLPGGFIGVDVFFVISGYLIIGMVVRSLDAGTFSFSDFYARRARRILPALTLTIVVALVFGAVLFSPGDFQRLGVSALLSILSVVNVYFWWETDYFTADAGSEPLVHAWSLSLEEQIYLIAPALLVALHAVSRRRVPRRRMPVVLLILTLASFAVGETLLWLGEQPAAFYLLPSRFGEFALGGLLCWLPRRAMERLGNPGCWLLVAAGLAAILVAAITITPASSFPGLLALVPVTGAALVIVGQGGTGPVPLLRLLPFVAVGLISYSLYLLHWVVFSFARYWLDRELDGVETTIAIGLSLALAWASFRFVEQPARYGRRLPPTVAATASAGAAVLAGLLGLFVYLGAGLPARIDEGRRAMLDAFAYHLANYGGTGFAFGEELVIGAPAAKPSFVLIGDSMARQFTRGLDPVLRGQGRSAIGYFADGCLLSDGLKIRIQGVYIRDCITEAAKAGEIVARERLPVVISFHGSLYRGHLATRDDVLVPDDIPRFVPMMGEAMLTLFKPAVERGAFAYIRPTPAFESAASTFQCLTRPSFVAQPCVGHQSVPASVALEQPVQPPFIAFLSGAGAKLIDLSPVLCPGGICERLRDGRVIYSDHKHLSVAGSELVAQRLLKEIDTAFNLRP